MAANNGCDDPANTFALRISGLISVWGVGVGDGDGDGIVDDVFAGWCARCDGWDGCGK